MTRAQVPEDAKIWVEVGTPRPKETSFDARIPFSICWVITDGVHRWKYLWINRRNTGLYIAHTLPGGFHESYHADGRRHWKYEGGNEIPLETGPPLNSLKGYITLQSSSADISSETLVRMGLSEFRDEPADKIIYFDNRSFGPWVHTQVYLVEPFRHNEIPLHVDYPCHYYLTTHTIPWIVIAIREGA